MDRQGENPTKYFFNLKKIDLWKKKLIREVRLENDEIISNFSLRNKEMENVYRNMYTVKIDEIQTSTEQNFQRLH